MKKGRSEERRRKFSQCQMEEQLASLSLLWGWIFFYQTSTHTRSRKHTCRATSCHSAPPARHLVIKGSPSGALHFSTARNESERRRERSGRALVPYALTSARRGNSSPSSPPSSARSSSAYLSRHLYLALPRCIFVSRRTARVGLVRGRADSVSRPPHHGERSLSHLR